MNFTTVDYAVLIIYFFAMAALGPLFASKGRTTEGYLLGDRSFPGWLIGFSMFATSISSVTFVAFPADAYKTAWFRMLPNYMMPIAVLIATFYFLPFFRKTQITSAYEYLESRFGPGTRLYAACAFILMQVVRVSMVLFLVSVLLFEMGLFASVYYCILAGGIITGFYTILGGIRAVLWTDFIQAMVLFSGGLVCLAVVIYHLPGGILQIFNEAGEAGKFALADTIGDDLTLHPVGWTPSLYEKTVTLFLVVGLSNWMLEYSANQNVIQRYAAAKSARDARIAMWVCVAFSIPTWLLFYFLGTSFWVFFQNFPTDTATAILTGEGGAQAEQILPYFVIQFLPMGFSGLVIAGVLAAAMSSLSSSINSCSAVYMTDIHKRHLFPGRTDRHYLLAAKGMGVFMGVVMVLGASLLHAMPGRTLQDTGNILTALTVGGLLGLFLLGFCTRVGDDRSVLTGIACTLLFVLWSALSSMGWLPVELRTPFDNYYTGLIGHVITFGVGFSMAKFFDQYTGRRARDLTNLTLYDLDGKPLK